jgi:pseudaminic acid synthase
VTQAKNVSINRRDIGPDCPPYICAEISANHNGRLERALELIDQASLAGADAVKIQTYRPDTITLRSSNPEFQIKTGLWAGRTLYDLYEEAHLPWEWHQELFEHAKKKQITLFSSPFDRTAVDLLEGLDAPAYKIASFEIVDTELIRYAASTQKPLIISTGLASADDVARAIEAANDVGNDQLIILHCVSAYPASPADYNLRTLTDKQTRFQSLVGLSDHTISNTTAVASVCLGSVFIEKHFTLDRNGGGPDDSFSLEPDDLRNLVDETRVAWDALGRVNYAVKSGENDNQQFRRSLYFVSDLPAGSVITENDIRSVRPGHGLPAYEYRNVIGQTLVRDAKKHSPVTRGHVEAPS